MFFDAEQTREAIAEVEHRPVPVQRGSGKSNLLLGVLVGILIGRKTK